jgi:NADH-quinone oxidoreductase subunit I
MTMGVFNGLYNLFKGLTITGKHLGRHAVTVQYPEQRDVIPERSRGIVVLLSDKETGELNCTACELCMRACPSAAIRVESHRDPETKRKALDSFTVDTGLCCFCGLCEEACNFSAIKLAAKYEFSTWNKEDLFWDKDKLQEVGRDVPYVDKRRKKKEAAAKKPDTVEKADDKAEEKTESKADAKAEEASAKAPSPETTPEQRPDKPAEPAGPEAAGEVRKDQPDESSAPGEDEGKTA